MKIIKQSLQEKFLLVRITAVISGCAGQNTVDYLRKSNPPVEKNHRRKDMNKDMNNDMAVVFFLRKISFLQKRLERNS